MIIPIRCFSCGTVIAHAYEDYTSKVQAGIDPQQALDEIGLHRYCCRRMYVAHIDLLEEVAPFSSARQ